MLYRPKCETQGSVVRAGPGNLHRTISGGSGANGKTVFTSTVTGILGDYAVTAPMEMLLTAKGERHETEIAAQAVHEDEGRRAARRLLG